MSIGSRLRYHLEPNVLEVKYGPFRGAPGHGATHAWGCGRHLDVGSSWCTSLEEAKAAAKAHKAEPGHAGMFVVYFKG